MNTARLGLVFPSPSWELHPDPMVSIDVQGCDPSTIASWCDLGMRSRAASHLGLPKHGLKPCARPSGGGSCSRLSTSPSVDSRNTPLNCHCNTTPYCLSPARARLPRRSGVLSSSTFPPSIPRTSPLLKHASRKTRLSPRRASNDNNWRHGRLHRI